MSSVQRRASFEAKKLIEALRSSLVSQLARSEIVSRLREVSFLGAIDYSPWAKRTGSYLTSRFDHSIGVAYLAQRAGRQLHLDGRQLDTALAAALLHDVGHGPLSHSLEPAFEGAFGVNHHRTTEELILGSAAKSRSLRSILDQFDVDAEEVVLLMNGKTDHPLAGLFSGPINFDTVEGILRAANYHATGLPRLDGEEIVDALVEIWTRQSTDRSLQILDEFWQVKGLIYSQLVRGAVGVVSDFKCVAFFDANRHLLSPAQFSWTDASFKARFPALFQWLVDDSSPAADIESHSSIPYIRRTFTVEAACSVDPSPLTFVRGRYCQQKMPAVLDWHQQTTAGEAMHIWEQRERSRSDANTANAH